MSISYRSANVQEITMTATLNAVAAAGSVSLGTVPAGFQLTGGQIESEALTLNNSLDVGDATDADGIFDGVDPSAGAASASFYSTTAGVYKAGKLFSADTALTVTNAGSAATPASDKVVTVRLYGIMTY